MRVVKEGDIALLLDPKKRGMLPLVRITKVQRGIDAIYSKTDSHHFKP
jgi:hypothetical protein